MEFIDRYTTTSGLKIGLPVLSCFDDAGVNILFRMQDECVIRLTKDTKEDYSVVSVDFGGDTAEVTVNYNVTGVQYLPLTEFFESLFVRSLPLSLSFSGVTGRLKVKNYNSSGVQLSENAYSITVCDCGGFVQLGEKYPFASRMPDTVRLFASSSFNSYNVFSLKFVGDAQKLTVENSVGTSIDSYDNGFTDGGCASGLAVYSVNAANRAAVVTMRDSANTEIASSIVEWLSGCFADKAMLLWWSNIDGGYKARVADVRRERAKVEGLQSYYNMFTEMAAKSASIGVDMVFQNLTARDMDYYGDILSSDEVYLVDYAVTVAGNALSKIPVVVSGDYPEFERVRNQDLNFNVKISETSNL